MDVKVRSSHGVQYLMFQQHNLRIKEHTSFQSYLCVTDWRIDDYSLSIY